MISAVGGCMDLVCESSERIFWEYGKRVCKLLFLIIQKILTIDPPSRCSSSPLRYIWKYWVQGLDPGIIQTHFLSGVRVMVAKFPFSVVLEILNIHWNLTPSETSRRTCRSTFLYFSIFFQFLRRGVKFSPCMILKLNGRGKWLSNNSYYTTSSRVIVIVIEGSILPFNLPFLVKILQCILIWRERLDREITLTAGDGPVSWRAVSTMNCAASSGFAPLAAWLVSAVDTRPADHCKKYTRR
jgi:hypothetical protein